MNTNKNLKIEAISLSDPNSQYQIDIAERHLLIPVIVEKNTNGDVTVHLLNNVVANSPLFAGGSNNWVNQASSNELEMFLMSSFEQMTSVEIIDELKPAAVYEFQNNNLPGNKQAAEYLAFYYKNKL